MVPRRRPPTTVTTPRRDTCPGEAFVIRGVRVKGEAEALFTELLRRHTARGVNFRGIYFPRHFRTIIRTILIFMREIDVTYFRDESME